MAAKKSQPFAYTGTRGSPDCPRQEEILTTAAPRRGYVQNLPISAGGTLKPLPFKEWHFSSYRRRSEHPTLPGGHPLEGSRSCKLLSCSAKVPTGAGPRVRILCESPPPPRPEKAQLCRGSEGNAPGRSPQTAGLPADLHSAAAEKRPLRKVTAFAGATQARSAWIWHWSLRFHFTRSPSACFLRLCYFYGDFHSTDHAAPQSSNSKHKTLATRMHRTGGHKETSIRALPCHCMASVGAWGIKTTSSPGIL